MRTAFLDKRLAALMTRALQATPREAACLASALLLLLEVDLRLRLTGFARLQSALRLPEHVNRPAETPKVEWAQARSMARAIGRTACLVPGARCLHRALALLLWLRRRGAAAELRLGVRRSGEGIEGHAWVEWHGGPLDERPSIYHSFEPLDRAH